MLCFLVEKYELERKALYDSLLRPSSPKESATPITSEEPDQFDELDQFDEPDQFDKPVFRSREITTQEPIDNEFDAGEHEEVDERMPTEIEENPIPEVENQDNSEVPDKPEEGELEAPVNLSSSPKLPSNTSKKPRTGRREKKVSSESDEPEERPVNERRTLRSSDKPKVFPIEKHKEEILDKILEKLPSPEVLAPVKLVISKKKGSIFKSRSLVSDGGAKKRRAVYKHKWTSDDTPSKKNCEDGQTPKADENSTYDDYGFSDEPLTRITDPGEDSDNDGGVTSIKCTKGDKGVSTTCYFIHMEPTFTYDYLTVLV